jgi:hypothetical protein
VGGRLKVFLEEGFEEDHVIVEKQYPAGGASTDDRG